VYWINVLSVSLININTANNNSTLYSIIISLVNSRFCGGRGPTEAFRMLISEFLGNYLGIK
jgi:hypothetical protein